MMTTAQVTRHDGGRAMMTTFTIPGSTGEQAISTFWLRQKLNRDKLAAFYRHVNARGNLYLINLDQFSHTKNA